MEGVVPSNFPANILMKIMLERFLHFGSAFIASCIKELTIILKVKWFSIKIEHARLYNKWLKHFGDLSQLT